MVSVASRWYCGTLWKFSFIVMVCIWSGHCLQIFKLWMDWAHMMTIRTWYAPLITISCGAWRQGNKDVPKAHLMQIYHFWKHGYHLPTFTSYTDWKPTRGYLYYFKSGNVEGWKPTFVSQNPKTHWRLESNIVITKCRNILQSGSIFVSPNQDAYWWLEANIVITISGRILEAGNQY